MAKQTEAMKLALNDLIAEYHMENSSFAKRVDDIFKEVPAQPQQEPVAWITEWEGKYSSGKILDYIAHTRGGKVEYTPLYTTPPQRTWVGLTDEEIEGAIDDGFAFGLNDGNVSNQYVIRYVRVIEAKLKEKNHHA